MQAKVALVLFAIQKNGIIDLPDKTVSTIIQTSSFEYAFIILAK